ncbi:assembly protein [Photorhabdus khanii]|uniref:Assembly protein n=1 Tax=Photorhabdus khanii TaxID=1004150 RepID=A0A7C9GMT3_9GAMM|nr:zonular occludens toxin domain-containing protein [Photorhabdus khanii]MQL47275.1 assembly protein [Photorhabdus khanii]MQL47285.1 assembly protein [Photorhabdus khanii]
MAVYVVTGKLGSGKTLVAVGKIQDKIVSGCKIATNLDLKLHKLPRVGIFAKSPHVIRIPDKPSVDDLHSIGIGNESYDESKNGLLVLDECGTWFNSRSWADKERQAVINWFLHARKLGWDIIFLIQDLSIMDKQARVALAEHVVYCRRLDKITLPFIGAIYSLITGSKLPLPKIHIGIVKYGDLSTSMTVEKWTYTGRDLYSAYDTKQAFSDSYAHSPYSYLTPYLSHGRYAVKRDSKFYMKLTKIYFKKYSRILCFTAGVFMAFAYSFLTEKEKALPVAYQPVKQEAHSVDLTDLKITSSYRLGSTANYDFTNAKKEKITSDALIKAGFNIVYIDSCTVDLIKGGKHEKVTC